ncbi:MAG TPA: glycine betaine ABC transporter substrate-binding protein [Solirubrobacterales bacterium]|jgi:glycine betaine/choline ABC-type transport system substrate-binding protein|nr:glycine betaine ABC transporter substrate-binding protein [Solirubrobacterales bacterium]
MRSKTRLRGVLALLSLLVAAVALAACGSDDGTSTEADSTAASTDNLIQDNPDNNGVKLTIGSKNFTEQFILGEIYAQALEAAGYDVSTDLNLGSEQVALKALENGDISGYPEYTSTALTSFFDTAPEDVPSDAQEAVDQTQDQFAELGLTAFSPTPFADANAVGLLQSTADELGVSSISDLEGKSQDLTLAGSPECRQRIDCLAGLEKYYGLQFGKFTPIDIGLRYEVLDKGDADLSILFTSDAQLFVDSDKYTLLEDDKGVLPAGNVIFISDEKVAQDAGPDYQATIEKVQEGLTLEVMQELNARVDVDKQKPEDVAAEYLQEAGYTE